MNALQTTASPLVLPPRKTFVVPLGLAIAVLFLGSGCTSTPMGFPARDHSTAGLAHTLDVPESSIQPTPLPGLYAVQHDHDIAYVSADGKYALRGPLYDVSTSHDLTEDALRRLRLSALARIDPSDLIVFAPAGTATRYTVAVFTDVDCGYCRQFHSRIAEYNARGIAIRYLAWPRSGPDTPSWQKAEGVWCSSNRPAALTAATLGQPLAAGHCANPVAREYQLGVDLGVQGTPTLILPDGSLLAGYLPPDALAERLARMNTQGAEDRAAH
jgi:thiol:disulfide interchange protein DsbC